MLKPTARIAAAAIPSRSQWYAVTVTAKTVSAPWAGPSHRHRLRLTVSAATAINIAQATCIDGMAAS
jgi:hypothetical protein